MKHQLEQPPIEDALRSLGWQPRYSQRDGTLRAFIRNKQEGTSGPSLTIAMNPKMQWFIKAEASLPKLLRGVNIPLLCESEIEESLNFLSAYVEKWSGREFDAYTSLVCRVDFTKDIQVSQSAIVPMMNNLARVQIPRYDRTPYNDESVVFTPKGESSRKKSSKRISVYNKLGEVTRRKGSEEEQRNAKGILRVEVELKTKAISYLTKRLRLPGREAQYVLTREVSNFVLQDALQKLQFDALNSDTNKAIEKLISEFGIGRAKGLIGFIELRKQLGEDLHKNQALNYPSRTYFKDLADCRKAGVLP